MFVAQSEIESLTLVSVDRRFTDCGVALLPLH
jgi:hypothetical protein